MSHFIAASVSLADNSEETKEIVVALLSPYAFNYYDTEGDGVIAHAKTDELSAQEIEEIEQLLQEFNHSVTWEYKEKENWNKLWEENFFDPLQIGEVHIRAPFHPEVSEGIVLTIEPRMSFGTGHHATTQLMIQHMLGLREKISGQKVLDMGAGTGILGIVAEKLGASEVLGIEIDDWVVDNANDNLVINKCSLTQMIEGTAETLQTIDPLNFKIILANIHREVILNDLPAYNRVLDHNGYIFISGLQINDLPLVKAACESLNLEFVAEDTLGQWGVLVYLKKAS